MPSISVAMERATSVLYQAGDELDEILKVIQRRMPRPKLAQPYDALAKGLLWIVVTVLLDHWSGHASVLQVLYLAPVWLAFETANIGVAAALGALIVPVSTIMSPVAPWGMLWDVVVRAGIMASVIIIMTFHGRRYLNTFESSQRDALTGAYNRAGFETLARRQIDDALTNRTPLTVAVIDCDNFKELNDLKGHAFGDQILRTLVRTLVSTTEGATIGRTGGDEFVIVDQTRTEEQLGRALAYAVDKYSDATLVMGRRSSFTVGIASLGEGGMRYESLLEAADRDMYRNKTARYQVMTA